MRCLFGFGYPIVIFIVLAFVGGISSPVWMMLLECGEVFAQPLAPQARNKYEAGLEAMKKGDCNAARNLIKEAIKIDPNDRQTREGMFPVDYYPNAKLRELEAKCTSTPPSQDVKATAPPAPTPVPPAPLPQPPSGVPPETQEIKVTKEKPVAPPGPEIKPPELEKPKPEYIIHKVRDGETGELIAKWYSGSADTWEKIRPANPELPSKLKGGVIVKIPKKLATVHQQQPGHALRPEPPPAVNPPPPKPVPREEVIKVFSGPLPFGPK